MAKAAFNEKKTLSTSKLVTNETSQVLHLEHSFCGAATWTLWKVDENYLKSFKNVMLEKDGEDQLERSCER